MSNNDPHSLTVTIAFSFMESFHRLQRDEQSRALSFIQELHRSTKSTGASLERIRNSKSKNLWSGRIDSNLRAILYHEGDSIALLYADHHDAAYRWAERRDIGRHPVMGAFQVVDTIETIREIEREVVVEPSVPPLFVAHGDAYLLSLGVPFNWLPVIRKVGDSDQLLIVAESLPPDVADRLLALADGELVTPPASVIDLPLQDGVDPRRFHVVGDDALLAAALEAPFDRWIAFLHPTQRRLVDCKFSGPAKVSGSAGTGKTVVALHRARHLAQQGKHVLLTTFVKTLCSNLERNLAVLCTDDERNRILVSNIHSQALAFARASTPALEPTTTKQVEQLLEQFALVHAPNFDPIFVRTEWDNIIVPQGLTTWAGYRKAKRTGRGKVITVRERKSLWNVFEAVRQHLRASGRLDWAAICKQAVENLTSGMATSPFDAVIVDEVQDLGVSELTLVAALAATHPGNLLLCGDTGQRIYGGSCSLSSLGIHVRGRSTILRINYRTTEQIRRAADRLVGDTSDDMDGGQEARKGTRSLLRGPDPSLAGYETPALEYAAAAAQVKRWLADGMPPSSIALFARTKRQLQALVKALEQAELFVHMLNAEEDIPSSAVCVGTMHRAKGLEFKAVLVVAVTDKLLPHHLGLARAGDPLAREQTIDQERRLLYVALTRARNEVRITWHRTPSPFLSPLLGKSS